MTAIDHPAASVPGDAPLGTAAAHATLDVPIAHPDQLVDDVITGLRGRRFASAAVVAVCAEQHLVGLVTIERLLAAPSGTPVVAVMDSHPPVVAPGTDQEHAAWQAVHNDEPGLAVVDADGRLCGLIAPQRLLAVLLEEHDEDLARLGGFLAGTATARTASMENVGRRLWHRLPWLALGLLGAMASAGLVAAFESQLAANLLVAYFIPGVVYLADAVGTQTEALVVRGLSVGVSVRRLAVRETLTGVIIGGLLGALMFATVAIVWRDLGVAGAVAIATLAASSIATVVAMTLPWLLHRLGSDPAFGSGPLATVVQDLLSIVIYFAVVAAIAM